MRTIIFIFTILVFITGCDNNKFLEYIGLKERVTNVKQERNGITYLPNEEEPFTGKYEIFYSGGQKKREVNYKGGKQDGLSIFWFENGQKFSERNFKDGEENGLSTIWNYSGQKFSERNFKDGIEVIK